MADVVLQLFWLIHMDQFILRETPPDTNDHAHRPHLEGASIAVPIIFWSPAATVHELKQAKEAWRHSSRELQQHQQHQQQWLEQLHYPAT